MKSNIETVSSKAGEITLVTLSNDSGASVKLSSLGAGIISIIVPDDKGNMADVALGYADPSDYMADGPCAGKIPGRYANRIANGEFILDGKTYHLPINNGPNHLHGGPDGFQNHIWTVSGVTERSVTFSIVSPEGDAGYPGQAEASAEYTWSEDNTLTLQLTAHATAPTVINLTNHTYFNLGGQDSGTALNHRLQLNASHYLPTDSNLTPTGEVASVKSTPMDFTAETVIGERIGADFPALKYGKGYDNCWVIDRRQQGTLTEAARLTDPESGRVLKISTTQTAVQVYTGNWLEGCPKGKSGNSYHDYDAVAIECQNFPDAPNHGHFPSAILRPGETYNHTIIFHFTTTAKQNSK